MSNTLNNQELTDQALGDFLKQIYYQGKDDLGYSDYELARDIKVIQSQKQLYATRCELKARLNEAESIAADLRQPSDALSYIETSASGRWQPLSKRIEYLKGQQKKG